jgi:hypothetical protein
MLFGELGTRLLEAGRRGVGDVVGGDVQILLSRIETAERDTEGHVGDS